MKTYTSIAIRESHLAADLTTLLGCLEPADVAPLARGARDLLALAAVLAQMFDPPKPAPDRTPFNAAELNELERHVFALEGRFDAKLQALSELTERMADEIAGLHRLAAGQVVELAAQSEMLARRAERAAEPFALPTAAELIAAVNATPPGPVPADIADLLPQSAAARGVEPSANGHTSEPAGDARRLEIAKLLAGGPRTSKEVYTALLIPKGSMAHLIACPWFVKTDPSDIRAPYTLTAAGRAALAEAGYVLVPGAAEPDHAPDEPSAAEPPDPRTEPLDPKARAVEQCRLIAAAIVGAGADPLTMDQIARAAGLPLDVTQKRLARFGPSSNYGVRYFCKSEKHPGCWRVTNSGAALAEVGAG